MLILVTNDDSHSSPLLAWLLKFLEPKAELVIVVPKHEQSWTGKSITRFRNLHLEEINLSGLKGYSVDGTPADCVNIGIYHVCKKKPDLVVSGINAGLNAGLGFILSSGTVGAGFEANIANVPALALSQTFDSETMNRYTADYTIAAETLSRLESQTTGLLNKIFSELESRTDFLKEILTWNINLPFRASAEPEFKICSVANTRYRGIYERTGNVFRHAVSGIELDARPNTDSSLIGSGHIIVTPIDLGKFGEVDG